MGLEDELAKSHRPISEDRNAAGRATKQALPFIRVLGSSHGNQWVPYHAMLAATQDYEPVEEGFPRCDWLVIYLKMLLVTETGAVFGFWKLTITGTSLDLLAGYLAAHRMPTINPGVNDRNEIKFSIDSIVFTPFEPEGQED